MSINNLFRSPIPQSPSVQFIKSAPRFIAFFRLKSAQGTLHVELNPNHANSNAWYKATVRQGKKVISQGWDFDGDFVIDYLN